MLSNKEIVCPENLLRVAKNKKDVTAGIVNAGKLLLVHSTMEAVKENLITRFLKFMLDFVLIRLYFFPVAIIHSIDNFFGIGNLLLSIL